MIIGLTLYDKKGYRDFDKVVREAELYTYHPALKEDEVLFSPEKPKVRMFRVGPPFEWVVDHLLTATKGMPLSYVSTKANYDTVRAEMIALDRAGLIGPSTEIRR